MPWETCVLIMPAFNLEEITRRTFVRFVEHHQRLDSTNKLATELREELHSRAPALVLTDEQTTGRGRGNNSWWSSVGSLTFSLVLDADTHGPPAESYPLVALAAGLAVRSVLSERLPQSTVQIKWPNDVLVDDRKICGILCETRATSSGMIFVIGIGINVNNSLSSAPDDVRRRATSLYDITGDSVDLTDLLAVVLAALERDVTRLQDNAIDIIRQVAAFDRLRGHQVIVQTPVETLCGFCEGISTDGALLVQTESGKHAVRTGTVLSFE